MWLIFNKSRWSDVKVEHVKMFKYVRAIVQIWNQKVHAGNALQFRRVSEERKGEVQLTDSDTEN